MTAQFVQFDASPAPLEDQALENFIHDWIVGVTGLSGQLVRPRWQTEPGNLPDASATWVSFGAPEITADPYQAEVDATRLLGYNEVRRHELLSYQIRFYGPEAGRWSAVFRDGCQVPVNREVLTLNGFGLVEAASMTKVPELVKDKWYNQVILTVVLRRQVVRRYSPGYLESAEISLNNELYTTQIQVPGAQQ